MNVFIKAQHTEHHGLLYSHSFFKTQVRKDARAFIYLYFKNTTQENLEPYLLLLPYQNTTLLPPLFQSVIKEYMFLKTQQSKAACHCIYNHGKCS